jgi:iron complex outermembrane receptor protein
MTKNKLLLCGAAVCGPFYLATPARAQTDETQPTTQSDAPTHVTGVTVTARAAKLAAAITATKTDVPPIETPLNVQVVPLATLQDQAVVSIDQALKDVSGVTVGGGGGADNGQPFSTVTLRGFSTDAHFRNGVRLDSFGSDSGTESLQLANVESVTVLKGPAAILYGAVEPGGIVNIVTRQPQATPAYEVEQQFGSYAFIRTTVDATGPLTADGKLLYRLDASYQNSGSPIDLIYNRTPFIAPSLAWLPDANDRVTLEYEYKNLDQGQEYGFEPLLNGALINSKLSTNYGEVSPDKEQSSLVSLSWAHTFNDAWSLRTQALYNSETVRSAGIFPFVLCTTAAMDPSPCPTATPSGVEVGRATNQIANNDYTVSLNVDLVGHFDLGSARNTLLFGGDFVRFDFWGGILQAGFLDSNLSYIDAFNPVHPGTPFAAPLTPEVASTQISDTGGVYLQDQVKLPLGFEVLAGARYQLLNENGSFSFAGSPLAPNPTLNAAKITPRLGLLWLAAPWLSFYGNYATNFGPSNGATQPNGQLVPPTSAHQWELGVKADLFDGRLSASADYYDLTKTNIPTPDPLNPAFELVIGAARSTGVEVDIQGKITPAWSVIANYAYTDARIVHASAIDNSPPGTPLGEVPKNVFHLWTTYEIQSGGLKGLKFGGGATYNGDEPYLFAGANPPLIPAWQTFDLMVAYPFRVRGYRVTAQINATNIFDRRYFSDIQSPGFPPDGPFSSETAIRGDPREVVGTLRVDF